MVAEALIAADAEADANREYAKAAAKARAYYDALQNDAGLSGLQAGPSLIRDIQADPQAVAAQKKALLMMMSQAQNSGLTMQDQATLYNIQQQQAQQEQGARGAILQNARARGMMNSGNTLGAQLSGNQNAANQARAAGLQVGAQAQERGLQALMNGSSMAGALRGQSFNEGADKARQQDTINQFNAQMRNAMFANKMGLAGQQVGLDLGGAGAIQAGALAQAQGLRNAGASATQLGMGIATMGMKPAADAAVAQAAPVAKAPARKK